MPNPLRCFNCQKFGHHENNCPVDLGFVCANCGAGGHEHHTSPVKTSENALTAARTMFLDQANAKFGRKRRKLLKVTKNITYLEAKKLFESQTSELDLTKIVQSLCSNPESKTIGTQFFETDFNIHPSSKVITPSVKPKSQPKPTSVSQSQASSQSQSNSWSRSDSALSHSGSQSNAQSSSQAGSQSRPQSSSQSNSQSSSQKRIIIDPLLDEAMVEDRTLVEVRPPTNKERDITIPSKWQINMAS